MKNQKTIYKLKKSDEINLFIILMSVLNLVSYKANADWWDDIFSPKKSVVQNASFNNFSNYQLKFVANLGENVSHDQCKPYRSSRQLYLESKTNGVIHQEVKCNFGHRSGVIAYKLADYYIGSFEIPAHNQDVVNKIIPGFKFYVGETTDSNQFKEIEVVPKNEYVESGDIAAAHRWSYLDIKKKNIAWISEKLKYSGCRADNPTCEVYKVDFVINKEGFSNEYVNDLKNSSNKYINIAFDKDSGISQIHSDPLKSNDKYFLTGDWIYEGEAMYFDTNLNSELTCDDFGCEIK